MCRSTASSATASESADAPSRADRHHGCRRVRRPSSDEPRATTSVIPARCDGCPPKDVLGPRIHEYERPRDDRNLDLGRWHAPQGTYAELRAFLGERGGSAEHRVSDGVRSASREA